MPRLGVASICVALLTACGSDSDPVDDALVEMIWTAEPADTRAALCASVVNLGLDATARAWEASWNGDGKTDDDAVAAVLDEKC